MSRNIIIRLIFRLLFRVNLEMASNVVTTNIMNYGYITPIAVKIFDNQICVMKYFDIKI